MPFVLLILLTANIVSPRLSIPPELLIDPIEEHKVAWMSALAECESGGNPNAKVIDTNNYWSRGKYQYQLLTWLRYSELFGTTRENIYDEELQDKVTRYILDTKGSGDWWNCTQKIIPSLGAYPTTK